MFKKINDFLRQILGIEPFIFIILFILMTYIIFHKYSFGVSDSPMDFWHWLSGGAMESWRNAFEVWGLL